MEWEWECEWTHVSKKCFRLMILPLSRVRPGGWINAIWLEVFILFYFIPFPVLLRAVNANARSDTGECLAAFYQIIHFEEEEEKVKKTPQIKRNTRKKNEKKSIWMQRKIESYSFTCNEPTHNVKSNTKKPKCHLLAPVIVTIIIFM